MPRSGSVLGASAAGDAERRAHHGSSALSKTLPGGESSRLGGQSSDDVYAETSRYAPIAAILPRVRGVGTNPNPGAESVTRA